MLLSGTMMKTFPYMLIEMVKGYVQFWQLLSLLFNSGLILQSHSSCRENNFSVKSLPVKARTDKLEGVPAGD